MRFTRSARVLFALTSVALTLQVSPHSVSAAPSPTSSAAGAPCGGEVRTDDGRALTCTFSDEFDGTSLDRSKWSAVTTAETNFRNNTSECFVDSPDTISVSSGTLKLTTRAARQQCAIPHARPQTTTVISGSVSGIHSFAQMYGVFSVRAKFPAVTAAGLHSALWMWPVNPVKYGKWPLSGELDIAEFFSAHPDRAIPYEHYVYDPKTTSGTTSGSAAEGLSYSGVNVATNNYCLIDPKKFQTYTLTWTPTVITIEIDGRTCIRNVFRAYKMPAGAPFDQPFFMILTQALGTAGTANKPTSKTPKTATTEVDYVRVWK